MKKPHEAHELAYRRMHDAEVRSWGERVSVPPDERREIDEDDERFIRDVLAQPWTPEGGRAVELGCGTAPVLRLACAEGFEGLGLDVSKTAVRLARAQSKGLAIRFKHVDLCGTLPTGLGLFDVAIDGHCLHCIIADTDRTAFYRNVHKLLIDGGLFVVMSMCGPVDRRAFRGLYPDQKLTGGVVYAPYTNKDEFEGCRCFGEKAYLPTRRIVHWKTILSELRRAGFRIQMVRWNRHAQENPVSYLNVVAVRQQKE
ncbi:MAG: class I SAM-dependent methyltransferase [bacterium]|nr:class I SAM-dependent methyltransferase [bacterium]